MEDLNSNGEDTEYDSMDLMVSWQGRSMWESLCSCLCRTSSTLLGQNMLLPLIPSTSRSPPFPSQVGNTTDGGFGPGWIQDTGDDDL